MRIWLLKNGDKDQKSKEQYYGGILKRARLQNMSAEERQQYLSSIRSIAGRKGAHAKWDNLVKEAKAAGQKELLWQNEPNDVLPSIASVCQPSPSVCQSNAYAGAGVGANGKEKDKVDVQAGEVKGEKQNQTLLVPSDQ